jgi:hypothetical protein
MDLKKTGGHAFPTSDVQTAHAIAAAAISGVEDSADRDRVYTDVRAQALQGMTLRDYFAAKVLGGLASAYHENWSEEDVARVAYELADRMLAERAR